MKISVIVPIYNVERYLPKLIDSIIAQSFDDFELLLIDDGSKDNSGKICDDYEKKDPRIKVFHKENGGVDSARNYGIELSQGEFLYFADGDDELMPNCLMTLYKGMSGPDIELSIGSYYYRSNGVISNSVSVEEEDHLWGRDDIMLELLHAKYYSLGFACINLFRKSIIMENNLRFHKGILEDRLFLASYICCLKGKVFHTTKPIYIYNLGIGVMSQISKNSKLDLRNKIIFDRQCAIYRLVKEQNFSKRTNWWARHVMINSYVHKKKYFESFSDDKTVQAIQDEFYELTDNCHLFRFYMREYCKKVVKSMLNLLGKS